MVRHRSAVFCAAVAFLAGGCSTVRMEYKVPTAHFLSPETRGKRWKGGLALSSSSSQRVVLAQVVDAPLVGPVADTRTQYRNSWDQQAQGTLGLAERIDLSVMARTGPPVYCLKFQALGAPEAGHEKGWKLSVAARYGHGTVKHETDNFDAVYNVHTTSLLQGADLIVGYRYGSRNIAYANLFTDRSRVKGTIVAQPATILPVQRTGRSTNVGFLLGQRTGFGKGFFMNVELGIDELKERGSPWNFQTPFGLLFGWEW